MLSECIETFGGTTFAVAVLLFEAIIWLVRVERLILWFHVHSLYSAWWSCAALLDVACSLACWGFWRITSCEFGCMSYSSRLSRIDFVGCLLIHIEATFMSFSSRTGLAITFAFARRMAPLAFRMPLLGDKDPSSVVCFDKVSPHKFPFHSRLRWLFTKFSVVNAGDSPPWSRTWSIWLKVWLYEEGYVLLWTYLYEKDVGLQSCWKWK